MQTGRFLARVLAENPISRIKANILTESRKGKYSLEITGHLEEPICDFFRDEGLSVEKGSDPDVTEISWSHVENKD